jgi:hypothetical protein
LLKQSLNALTHLLGQASHHDCLEPSDGSSLGIRRQVRHRCITRPSHLSGQALFQKTPNIHVLPPVIYV